MDPGTAALREKLDERDVSPGAVRAAALLGDPRAAALADLTDLGEVRGLEQVIDCLVAPRELLARATIAIVRAAFTPSSESLEAAARWTLCPCADCARAAERADQVGYFTTMTGMAKRALRDAGAKALTKRSEGELLAALRAELVPWLLREGDPLEARRKPDAPPPPSAEVELRPPKAKAPAPAPVAPPSEAPPSELASAVEAAIVAGRERELRILRGRETRPRSEEIVAEALEWLAASLGDGWKALKAKLKRTGGGWTEELTLVKRALDLDAPFVYLRPERLVLTSSKLAAWRKKAGAPEGPDEVASVEVGGAWDLRDPQEGRQHVAAVAERVRTAALSRFARLRDPATIVDEVVALRGGVDALGLEVVLCHAGREAAEQLLARVTAAPDPALAAVIAHHGLGPTSALSDPAVTSKKPRRS